MKKTIQLTLIFLLLVFAMGFFSCSTNPEIVQDDDILTVLSTGEGAAPAMMETDTVVHIALSSHEQWDGSTTHFRWGDLSGIPLYAVSLYPDLGIIKTGKEITEEELTAFVKKNYELFEDLRVCLGTWFNGDDGKTYIDINVVLADKEAAMELAAEYNQISIFNLETFEETLTGGDGKPVENLPAPLDRLPEFK